MQSCKLVVSELIS